MIALGLTLLILGSLLMWAAALDPRYPGRYFGDWLQLGTGLALALLGAWLIHHKLLDKDPDPVVRARTFILVHSPGPHADTCAAPPAVVQ